MTTASAIRRAVVIAVVVVTWAHLGPAHWGGTLTAVTVRGRSMQPGIVAGDLVLVERQGPYGPGDVIAHDAAPDGILVLHRVVSSAGDRLVLRGDANDHDDDVQPRPDDVVGRAVVRIPAGEAVLHRIPLVAVLTLIASTLWHRPRRRRPLVAVGGR